MSGQSSVWNSHNVVDQNGINKWFFGAQFYSEKINMTITIQFSERYDIIHSMMTKPTVDASEIPNNDLGCIKTS